MYTYMYVDTWQIKRIGKKFIKLNEEKYILLCWQQDIIVI